MAVYKRGGVWWYKFRFANRIIRVPPVYIWRHALGSKANVSSRRESSARYWLWESASGCSVPTINLLSDRNFL
jgi:hypothetical protein